MKSFPLSPAVVDVVTTMMMMMMMMMYSFLSSTRFKSSETLAFAVRCDVTCDDAMHQRTGRSGCLDARTGMSLLYDNEQACVGQEFRDYSGLGSTSYCTTPIRDVVCACRTARRTPKR